MGRQPATAVPLPALTHRLDYTYPTRTPRPEPRRHTVFVYAAIGLLGLLFLLAMLFMGDVFGGDHDFDHSVEHDGDFGGGPSFLSARIISAFITAFGVG